MLQFCDSVYGKANVDTSKGIVNFWLGANVMIEYKYYKAIDFIQSNLQAESKIVNQDLAFVRDQRDLMKYKDGVNATKSQETALKQEIHKYKILFDAQNVKLESVSQQLKEKEAQVAKYRKMCKELPHSFSSPLQLQMPRHSVNPAEVSADSMPPPSASSIDPCGPIMDPTFPSSQACQHVQNFQLRCVMQTRSSCHQPTGAGRQYCCGQLRRFLLKL
jgi:hypothetical protein